MGKCVVLIRWGTNTKLQLVMIMTTVVGVTMMVIHLHPHVVCLTFGAPLQILQPAFSTPRGFRLSVRPVHSLMLFSHRFPCLPLCLPPWTVPCRIDLARLVACPYHFRLRLFTEVRRSSCGPMAFPILAFTSSLIMWSLYEILRSLQKHLIFNTCILLFNVCCYDPRFTCISKYGHGQATHQSYLGADGNVLVVPNDF